MSDDDQNRINLGAIKASLEVIENNSVAFHDAKLSLQNIEKHLVILLKLLNDRSDNGTTPIPVTGGNLSKGEYDLSGDDKELILKCFDVIREEGKASTSNLQRRLRLGYNRAAYVIDYFEKIGVIGSPDGAKPREILVDLNTFHLTF